MSTPAVNIDQTYRSCNPDQPLTALDDRYVDLTSSRGMKHIAKTITRSIRRSDEHSLVKLLFTGHRGSGKTTELYRLKSELERNNFFTVYMDVEELLDLGSLNYLDVLVGIAREVQECLHKNNMPLSDTLLDSISNWFAEHIIEEKNSVELQGAVETRAEARAGIPFFAELFAVVTSSIKAASSRRETIRKNLRREISVFMDKLNVLIGEARATVQKKGFTDLVLIVDGIEKMHYELNPDGLSSHSELFVQHAEQLRSPECHIIYTVPVSLAYNQNLGADFDATYVLPMVKVNEAGVAQLKEIVQKRVDIAQVFADPLLVERLAEVSGGVVRDLMRLIRMATDTDDETITRAEVDYAINTLKKEYDRLIRSSDLESFKRIAGNRRIQGGDEDAARLLNLRLVLEYQNGESWADLHPVIREIKWVQEALND
jgi:hypothetical protein